VALLLQGAVVFAGCLRSQAGGAQELRELNLKRLHVIQMDVTSDEQVAAAVEYVSRHIPPQGICMNDLCSNNEKVYDFYFPLVVIIVVIVVVLCSIVRASRNMCQ